MNGWHIMALSVYDRHRCLPLDEMTDGGGVVGCQNPRVSCANRCVEDALVDGVPGRWRDHIPPAAHLAPLMMHTFNCGGGGGHMNRRKAWSEWPGMISEVHPRRPDASLSSVSA